MKHQNFQNKKYIFFLFFLVVVIYACLTVETLFPAAISQYYQYFKGYLGSSSAITSKSTSSPSIERDLQNAAAKYTQGEKTNAPVKLIYSGYVYYFVPFEVNNTISGEFPGLMLDQNKKPVTNQKTLQELYWYAGVMKRFADNVAGFRTVATSKSSAINQYCKILQRQQAKLNGLQVSGTVTGVIYEGTKLAFDGVGMVKNAVVGFSALIKDLIKDQVKESIIKYFTSTDSRAVMDSVRTAYTNIEKATSACSSALTAWDLIASKNNAISTEQLQNATSELSRMFKHEALAIFYLRQALYRVNSYPRIITNIGKNDFNAGISGLDNLTRQLERERDYWFGEYENSKTFREMWATEQISRVKNK